MEKVVVTGANGHVGYNLARLLAERGYHVRAAVRDSSDAAKTAPLRALGVEVVSAELLRPETLAQACSGCDGLFQVAAVYRTWAKDPQREIVEPTVTGGLNALYAAQQAGVRKVVFTSSIAAVGSHAPPDRPLTEENWNDGAVSPYFRAKTMAERKAWEFARASGLNLVTVCPGAVIGPGFFRHTPSTYQFELLLRGRMPFVLPTGFTFVDVRDVAKAHLLAYQRQDASGRYIAADRCCDMLELVELVRRLEPGLKLPTRRLPRALLPTVPVWDWLLHLLTGAPRLVTRAFVAELGGKCQRASSERIRRELGWEPMPFEQSLKDTLAWIREKLLGRMRIGG